MKDPTMTTTTATQYFAEIGYSDVRPFEVVRQVSAKTFEIRAMNAEMDPSFKLQESVGGFFAHVSNQNDQKWVITPDPTAKPIKIRLHKDGWWRSATGEKFRPTPEPRKFYDFNF